MGRLWPPGGATAPGTVEVLYGVLFFCGSIPIKRLTAVSHNHPFTMRDDNSKNKDDKNKRKKENVD